MSELCHRLLSGKYAIWLLFGWMLTLTGMVHAAGDALLQPETFRPVDLQYQARKLFITANTRVQLSSTDHTQARLQLYPVADQVALLPSAEQVILTKIESSVLGRNTLIQTWMNPDGGILQMSSLRTGHKERYRRYRYLPDQVYSIKRFPSSSGESSQSWEQWSDTGEDFYTLPDNLPSNTLMEPEGLFYFLNVVDWSKTGKEQKLYLFDPDGIVELNLKFLGTTKTDIDFEEKLPDSSTQRIKESTTTQEILMEASPWKGKGQAKNFDFLGFKGTVRLFVDPDRQVVVLMRGDIDVVGEVDVRLKTLEFR
ncbi:hypothetical protein [Hahella ganghwensis]|uniref:hypothetical protein n=1 Tax=Hahella ganghwensis TaxID=286420 RepID=UPI00036333BA|nr:hypothetical protein [Hahella ganghwensis]